MPEKEGHIAKNKPGSGWRHINGWDMFAYSISSACFCTAQTAYWSAMVRYGEYKLTCSSGKCPWEPLYSEEIVSLGFTVITRIRWGGGRWLALISPITFNTPWLKDAAVSDQPNALPRYTFKPKDWYGKHNLLSAASNQLSRGALFI